jgi:hypothetical protein
MEFKLKPSGGGMRFVPSVRKAPFTCAPIKMESKTMIVLLRICRKVFMTQMYEFA